MATNGQYNLRKDFKLETFLKKAMDLATFNKIKFYEQAIVEHGTSKEYRTFIVTDQWIYSTESPPKTLKKEIHMKDIVDIEIRPDFPDFLTGDIKDNCQHLVIHHYDPSFLAEETAQDLEQPMENTSGTLHRSRQQSSVNIQKQDVSQSNTNLTNQASSATINTNENEINPKKKTCHCGGPSRRSKSQEQAEIPVETNQQLDETGENLPTAVIPITQNETIQPLTTTKSMRREERKRRLLLEKRYKVLELSVYILNGQTPVLILTRDAWNVYLMSGTHNLLNTSQPESISSNIDENAFLKLFYQLKQDIYTAGKSGSLQDRFYYWKELHQSCQKHYLLRKLFWRNTDLFVFLLNDLEEMEKQCKALCLSWNLEEQNSLSTTNKSPVKTLSEMNSKTIRSVNVLADYLEYATLLVDILAVLMNETDTLYSRSTCLFTNQCCEVYRMIQLIIVDISLPPLENMRSEKEITAWEECNAMRKDFLFLSSNILSHLIFSCQFKLPGIRESLNEVALVSYLEQQGSIFELFLTDLIQECLELFSPNGKISIEPFKPDEAVFLFQLFTWWYSLFTHSSTIKRLVQERYMVDFKYFLQGPLIVNRFPMRYPISSTCLRLIAETTAIITERKAVFDSK